MHIQTTKLYLISACLLGIPCRYDGQHCLHPALKELYDNGQAVAVCPECLGGLETPRSPCEIQGTKVQQIIPLEEQAQSLQNILPQVLSSNGVDCSAAYQLGAVRSLELALQHGIKIAILKDKSPSCGSTCIYDGSFSGKRIAGAGITSTLLRKHGIDVYSEENFKLV